MLIRSNQPRHDFTSDGMLRSAGCRAAKTDFWPLWPDIVAFVSAGKFPRNPGRVNLKYGCHYTYDQRASTPRPLLKQPGCVRGWQTPRVLGFEKGVVGESLFRYLEPWPALEVNFLSAIPGQAYRTLTQTAIQIRLPFYDNLRQKSAYAGRSTCTNWRLELLASVSSCSFLRSGSLAGLSPHNPLIGGSNPSQSPILVIEKSEESFDQNNQEWAEISSNPGNGQWL